MAANTLVGTDEDLGDVERSYVFDLGLARSLLATAGALLTACVIAATLLSMTSFPGHPVASSVLFALLVTTAIVASWGVAIGVSRLRRSDDRFVVHRFGLSHHHAGHVDRTRWVDVAVVEQTGHGRASRSARWNGSSYRCRVERRDGTSTTFDNYVVDARGLGYEIERRSLV